MSNSNGKSKLKNSSVHLDKFTMEEDFDGIHFRSRENHFDR